MKTLEEELAEVHAKFEKERLKTIKEEKVRKALGKEVQEYDSVRIHQYPLYGAVGSISFKPPFAESLRKGKTPDRYLLEVLMGWFPPVPKVRVKSGCLSFRPVPKGYDPFEDPKLENAELTDLHGVTIKVDTSSRDASIRWYGVLAGDLWAFEVHFPLHKLDIGDLDARAVRWGRGGDGPIKRWEVCQFHPSNALCNAQVTRWGSGGPEYPNDFTLSFDPDSGQEVDFPGLIKEEVKA